MEIFRGNLEPATEPDDPTWEVPCPKCGKAAEQTYFERLDCGCMNGYSPLYCKHCGHAEGFEDLEP